jgi:hypothetical protein
VLRAHDEFSDSRIALHDAVRFNDLFHREDSGYG